MGLRSFIHTHNGHIVISIVLGLGLASLFRKACHNKNCIVFKAPEIKEIKDKVFKFENKCYKYTEQPTTCNSNKRILEFA
jgi:hypothetical protein